MAEFVFAAFAVISLGVFLLCIGTEAWELWKNR